MQLNTLKKTRYPDYRVDFHIFTLCIFFYAQKAHPYVETSTLKYDVSNAACKTYFKSTPTAISHVNESRISLQLAYTAIRFMGHFIISNQRSAANFSAWLSRFHTTNKSKSANVVNFTLKQQLQVYLQSTNFAVSYKPKK